MRLCESTIRADATSACDNENLATSKTGYRSPHAALFLLVIFIVSPLSLYFDRRSSLFVVLGLFAASWLAILTSAPYVRIVRTPIDLAAAIFLGYMSLNCIVSLMLGHPVNNTVSEVVGPVEIYMSFQIAKRVNVSNGAVRALFKWILILGTARSAWLVFSTLALIHIPTPIYSSHDLVPLAAIGRFVYERPFDPVAGMLFAIALMLYAFGIERRLSLLAALITTISLILGMTRSEWIAGIGAVFLATYYFGELNKAFRMFAVIGLVLAANFYFFPELRDALSNRLITKTMEQIHSAQETPAPEAVASEQVSPSELIKSPGKGTIGGLRIREFYTTFGKFKSAPIFGHGLGSTFGTELSYEDTTELTFIQIHNSYLNLLANAGLVGIGLLFFVILRVRRLLLRGLQIVDPDVRAIFSIAAGMLAWYGIFMGFQPIYVSYHLPVLIGIIWGFAAQRLEPVNEQSDF